MRDHLLALVRGELLATFDVATLFLVDLTGSDAIAKRQLELVVEHAQLAASIGALQERLASLDTDFPAPVPPPRPALLDQPPSAPQSQPSKPSRRRGSTADAQRAQREYQRQVAEYETQVETQRAAMQSYQEAQRAYAVAEADFRDRLAARTRQVDAAREQLETDLAISRVRQEIVEARASYLTALFKTYDQMSGAARRSFAFLGERRTALRSAAGETAALAEEAERASGRLAVLADFDEGGRLVGFVVDQEALAVALRGSAEALQQRARSLAATAAEFERLAKQQEQAGAALFGTLLHHATRTGQAGAIDQLFVEHSREMRRLRRQVRAIGQPVTTFDTKALRQRVQVIAPNPDAVGTTVEGKEIVAAVSVLANDLDAGGTLLQNSIAHWQLAFEREAVTALEGFATRATRDASYRLSHELIEDLQLETGDLVDKLLGWARVRLRQLGDPRQLWRDHVDGSWLLRAAGVVALLAALLAIRRRSPVALSWLVNRVVRARALRRRVGAAVRWANLLQEIVPIVAQLLIVYAVLAIVGLAHAEMQIAVVWLGWIGCYLVGRAALLGLTRPISRGRPALLPARPATVALLQLTYQRLGLFLVLVLGATDMTQRWIGSGRLQTLVDGVFLIWLFVWASWAALAWRAALAEQLQTFQPEQRQVAAVAAWMSSRRAGALLSPLVLTLLLAVRLYALFRRAASVAGIFAFLRATRLRRQSRRVAEQDPALAPRELPARYLAEFPLYPVLGDGGPLVLPREALVEQVLKQLQNWRASRADGSLVLLGEKGSGKTTLTGQLLPRIGECPVTVHTWSRKTVSEPAVVEEFAPLVLASGARTVDDLVAHLNDGDERVVLIDEAHNVFLRTIDGYLGYEALVRLVNATSRKVFWVLVFNSYSWQFLNESRRRVHYFRRLLPVPSWSTEEIRELINRRNQRTGLSIEFDEMLLDERDGNGGDFELVESAEGYFRLLREASEGNPRIALYLWLDSLHVVGNDQLRVGLFHEPQLEKLDGVTDDLLFALAAVAQHENLSVEDLGRTMNFNPAFAAFALQFLAEYGLLEPKPQDPLRLTLAPRFYRQVLHLLRTRHLIAFAR